MVMVVTNDDNVGEYQKISNFKITRLTVTNAATADDDDDLQYLITTA